MQGLVQAKKGAEAYDLLKEAVINAPKTYFRNCLIGYLVAISITIAIMFIFDHGQPALLYLAVALIWQACFFIFFDFL